jgi:hypothetical protein
MRDLGVIRLRSCRECAAIEVITTATATIIVLLSIDLLPAVARTASTVVIIDTIAVMSIAENLGLDCHYLGVVLVVFGFQVW